MDTPEIIIVVPCYNEEHRLDANAFCVFMRKTPSVGFCFVNDGSRDHTLNVIKGIVELFPNQAILLDLKKNSGKAEAVRQGINHAISKGKVSFSGYWDADLSVPLDEILDFIQLIQSHPQIECLWGIRVRRMGARIVRKPSRHYLGRIFATVVSLLFQINTYDTQCGAKIIAAGLAKEVFNKPFTSKWIFDVELICRIIKVLGKSESCNKVYEMPLKIWAEKSGSKLRPIHYFMAPLELIKIYYNMHKRDVEGKPAKQA